MKKLFLFPLFLLSLALSACGVVRGSGDVISETRSISSFSEIRLAGIGEVIVTQGDEISLKVEAEDNLMRYLQSDVHGDTLVLGLNDEAPMISIWPTRAIKFYVTVTDLNALTVAGSGDIRMDQLATYDLELNVLGSGNIRLDMLEADQLTVNIAGSGNVKVETLTVEETMTTISGSGKCTLDGETGGQAARITGSGDYQARNLQSDVAQVTITGSGDGYVSVSDELNVRITGSGRLHHYGSPKVDQTILGSGDVVSPSAP